MPRNAMPTVSIVIPAYNEETRIAACLLSCIVQSDPADEIVVVDNNSTDGTADVVRRLAREHPRVPIRLLHEPSQGLLPARDTGMGAATGDVLGRIDADSLLHPDWVRSVRRSFVRPSVAGATGPVAYYDLPIPRFWYTLDTTVRRALFRGATDYTFLFGSNMAVRRSTWLDIKDDLDPDTADELHEDMEIALSLFDRGAEVVFDPGMIGGISTRRVEDRPLDYLRYIMRYERTLKSHRVESVSSRIPMAIGLASYVIVRSIRRPDRTADLAAFTGRRVRERGRRRAIGEPLPDRAVS